MPEPMTAARLEAIRAREQAATPGPWDYIGDNIVGVVAGCNCPPGGVDDIEGVYYHPEPPHETHIVVAAHTEGSLDYFGQYRADCHFIAECRTAVPDLLAHVSLLEGLIHDLSEESRALEVGRQLERGKVLEMAQLLVDATDHTDPRRAGYESFAHVLTQRQPALPSLPPDQVRAERDSLKAALRDVLGSITVANTVGVLDPGSQALYAMVPVGVLRAARSLLEDA